MRVPTEAARRVADRKAEQARKAAAEKQRRDALDHWIATVRRHDLEAARRMWHQTATPWQRELVDHDPEVRAAHDEWLLARYQYRIARSTFEAEVADGRDELTDDGRSLLTYEEWQVDGYRLEMVKADTHLLRLRLDDTRGSAP